MKTLATVVVAGVSTFSCGTGAHCVGNADCASGEHCNTALALPTCQPLYTGGKGSTCSENALCTSKVCAAHACLDIDQKGMLGPVVPVTVTWVNHSDDGGIGTSAVVIFTDDARNDCAAMQAKQTYGNSAMLWVETAGALNANPGATLTWITEADHAAGKGRPPFAFFLDDHLSGQLLFMSRGSVTLLSVPSEPTQGPLVVSLDSSDGGVHSTFAAAPLCP
jgi:hypothetical protein